MLKKIATLGAAVALSASLAACGSGTQTYQPDVRAGDRCKASYGTHQNWDGRVFNCVARHWVPQYSDQYWSSYTHSNRYTPPNRSGYSQPKTVYTQPGVRKPYTKSASKPKSVYSKPAKQGSSFSKPKSVYTKSGSSFGGKRK